MRFELYNIYAENVYEITSKYLNEILIKSFVENPRAMPQLPTICPLQIRNAPRFLLIRVKRSRFRINVLAFRSFIFRIQNVRDFFSPVLPKRRVFVFKFEVIRQRSYKNLVNTYTTFKCLKKIRIEVEQFIENELRCLCFL